MNPNGDRPTPESLLAKLHGGERANLRVYIGAAPGVVPVPACPPQISIFWIPSPAGSFNATLTATPDEALKTSPMMWAPSDVLKISCASRS